MNDPFFRGGAHSWLLEYMHRCRIGEILVGHELLQEFDRIDADLESPDIKFDLAEAHKRIKFIENECKHFEAPFAGKPFLLELFQKAFIESIYAFYVFDEEIKRDIRLIQEALYEVGRKNGKTPLISAMILADFFCGPMGTRALCTSNDYDQASLMFDAIDAMREQSKTLERVTRKNNKGIFFGNQKRPKKTGKFSRQNKGSIRRISARTRGKEGRNIAIGAADEVHEMEDNKPIMPVRQALSTQEEPLYYELTTEGFVNNGYLDGRTAEARKVLNGEIDRPRWRIWMYTQDNEHEVWQDEKTWIKSNPGLGVIKRWSYIRKMVDEARTNRETRAYVLAKDFNIKQNNAAAWLMAEEIACTLDPVSLEQVRNAIAIGAADLSKTGDLANAKALVMVDGKKVVFTRYFIPEGKMNSLSEKERQKYEQWRDADLLTISPGYENDFSLVTKWFIGLVKAYGLRFLKIGYDKWSAVYWVKEMEGEGFDMQRVAQDWGSMTEPMRLVGNDLRTKNLNYNQHEIDKFCLENTAMLIDGKDHIMPGKVEGKDELKIDGAVTMIIGYRVYIDNRSDFIALSNRRDAYGAAGSASMEQKA